MPTRRLNRVLRVFASIAPLVLTVPPALAGSPGDEPFFTNEPEAAGRMAEADVEALVRALREELDELERRSDVPVGRLASELEQARRDVERLAELLLREQLQSTLIEGEASAAQARAESLGDQLSAAEGELDRARDERDRLQSVVAESNSRLDDLADRLNLAQGERDRLEREGQATRAELNEAEARVEDLAAEMAATVERTAEAVEEFRVQALEAQRGVVELERRVAEQRRRAQAELAERDRAIEGLQGSQDRVREILRSALAEVERATAADEGALRAEMLDQAEVSVSAREDVLAQLGFERGPDGALLPPERQGLAAAQPESFAGIEPAASPEVACPLLGEPVDRAYLIEDGIEAEAWRHYLIGLVTFPTGDATIEQGDLRASRACLDDLARRPAWYFKIVGHTDSRGEASTNARLSLERARAARERFLELSGLPGWRVFASGQGEAHPLADNGTETGRELNRRVEVFAVAPSG